MDPDLLTKVVIFLGAFLAILAVGRLAGRISGRLDAAGLSTSLQPGQEPGPRFEPDPEPSSSDLAHPEPVAVPPALRFRDGSPLELRGYYFDHCDAAAGPPDQEVFCDDLHLDVCDPRTGNSWQPTFTIATPRGLAQQLKDNNWDYMEGDGMLIVPRCTMDAVLKAAMQRVTEQFDAGSDPQNEDPKVPLL